MRPFALSYKFDELPLVVVKRSDGPPLLAVPVSGTADIRYDTAGGWFIGEVRLEFYIRAASPIASERACTDVGLRPAYGTAAELTRIAILRDRYDAITDVVAAALGDSRDDIGGDNTYG